MFLNEVSYLSTESTKKIDMNLPLNMQIIKLRKVLAK